MGARLSLTLLPARETPFLLGGCLVKPCLIELILPCLFMSCFVLFGCCFLESCSFFEEEMGGVDLGDGEV